MEKGEKNLMYQHGGDIYSNNIKLDFSANINPFGMPYAVKKAAENAVEDCVNYPDTYCRELTKGISIKENIKPEYILCGNGAADLIFRFVLAKSPKKALLLAPSFSEYETALNTVNCTIVYHTLQEEYRYCLTQQILNEITEEIDVVILCNPNNPTGILIENDLLYEIVSQCHKTNTFLFLDECFLDFIPNGEKISLKEQINYNKNSMILKAFTKMYGMAGLRLGYCICSDIALIEKMRSVSQSWAVSIPAQAAGVAALNETEFVKNTIAYIQQEKQYLLSELENIGISYFTPSANYIFFKAEKGYYEMLLKKGILIRSCHNYKGLCHGYYRIAIKTHEQNKILIEALREVKKCQK